MSNQPALNVGLRYEIDTEVNNQSRVDELNPLVQPFVTGERKRDLNNFAPASALPGTAADPACRSRRLRHLLRPHRPADPVARARARRPRAAHRGSRRQRLLPRSGDRPASAVRADALQSVHRLHPARRRRVGHQHHRLAPAESDGARAPPGRRGRAVRCASARRRRAQPGRDFLIGRTVGEVFNPVVGGRIAW